MTMMSDDLEAERMLIVVWAPLAEVLARKAEEK
jgi:hypothetical protein